LKLQTLVEKQGGDCFLCGLELNANAFVNIDHLYPRHFLFSMDRSAAGLNRGNIVAAHQACNVAKGARLPSQDEVEKYKLIYGEYPRYYKHIGVPGNRRYIDIDFDTVVPSPGFPDFTDVPKAGRWYARLKATARIATFLPMMPRKDATTFVKVTASGEMREAKTAKEYNAMMLNLDRLAPMPDD